MTTVQDSKCLIIDYGNYFPIAERLGREDGFNEVFYYCPYVFNGFPDHRPIDIGRNVPNVIRVKEWASVISEVDVVIFPDSHEPALQLFFESIGKKVFGCKYGCELEHDRKRTKEIMKELDLPINEYFTATGVDELDDVLMQNDDMYVKSSLRGDMETFHHENYVLSKGEMQRMRSHLGTYQNQENYIIESPVESVAEIGIDTFAVSGQYPFETLTGIELKDTGYYGQILPYNTLPRQLKLVTDKFAEIFKDLNYTGAFSDEVIISKDKKGYLLDMTCRFPSPPCDLMMEMFTNFPQIIFDVANGLVPVIKHKYDHGVQLIIKSDIARTEPSPLIIPDEYKNFVKVKNLVIDDDGTYYYTPQNIELVEIGSVVGLGNSMQEAVAMAKEIAESIKGFDIKINTDCIEDAEQQINALKRVGINYLTSK